MDFQSVLVEIAEAFVAENYRSQLPQGILLNQASISGALPPPPSAGSSVATLHELTSSATEQRQEALSSASDVGGDADQASSGSARRSPSEGANSASASTGGTGGTSVGTNHGGASGGDFRNATAKQIGVSIQSLAAAENSGYLATMLHGLLQERPATGGEGNAIAVQNSKSIPVHCLVEQGCGQATEPTVNNDCYAIIPSCTLFSDLVRTALINLGYSANEVIGARGAIQIKNWRPLTFDQITENAEATVGDILGELATIAMLRIRLYSRPKPNAASDVKEKLLQVLLAQSQSVLMSTGCPIDQTMLAALTKGRIECDISEDTRKKFDQWYLQQVFQHCRQVVLQQHHHQQQQQVAQQLQQQLQKQHTKPPISNQQPEVTYSTTSPPRLVSAPPLSQHRTRIRTSFDPELELPKLHQWFSENQHPSRVQIQQYVKDLNSLESRRGRKPLDINNVVYWFKNARAAHKRAEQRFCSDGSTTNGLRSPYSELAGESHSHMERFETGNGGLIGHHRLVMGSPYHVDDDHLVGHHAESSTGYDPLDSGDDNLEEDDYVHTLDLSVKKQKMEEEVPREDEENNDKRPKPPTPVNNISLDNLNKISLDNSDKILVKREPHYSSSEQSMEDSSAESGDEDILMDHREDGTSSNDATPLLTGAGLRRESMESQAASETGNPNGNGQLSPTSSVISTPSTPTTTAVAATQGIGENGIGVCAPVQVNCLEERRKRNRTFIDPVTEVPRLEYWFESNTHPSHSQIVRFTHELNCMPYRSKFPKLEPKNIQFWFKNRRAKCKRLHLANFPHNGVERLVQNAIRDTENAAALHGLSAVIRDSAGNANSSIRGISAAM